MFSTTQDILYVVLSFASLWVGIFLCWALYYAGKILKNANEVIEEVREYGGRLDEAIRIIRDRMETLSGTMGVVATTITRVVGRAIEKKFAGDDDEFEESTKEKRTQKKKK